MIPFDFDYYKPQSVGEAVRIMQSLKGEGKNAYYYAGGTELLTNFRKGKAKTDAVIDVKGIAELTELKEENGIHVIGAAMSLNQIVREVNCMPLRAVFDKIADHTTRNALTLGGNLCGRLTYKEAVLPLLALEASVVIAGPDGVYEKSLKEVFDKRMKLASEELLVQVKVRLKDICYFNLRETEGTDTDYPILHLFASLGDEALFVGLSGYSSLPVYETFKDRQIIDGILAGKMDAALHLHAHFEDDARACQRASASYRNHLLKCAFEDMVSSMKGGGCRG